jgi:hypothetical protein
MNRNRIMSIIVPVIFLAAAAIMLIAYGLSLPKTDNGEKTLTLEIKYADKSFVYEELTTDKGTVLELLREYDDLLELGLITESSAFGEYITSLKGTAENDGEGYYYTYKLDGQYALLGVSEQSLTKEDGSAYSVITFEYGAQNYDDSWNITSTALAPGGDGSIAATPEPGQKYSLIIVGAAAGVIALGGIAYLVFSALKKRD